jgi:chromosome segregation ATPase
MADTGTSQQPGSTVPTRQISPQQIAFRKVAELQNYDGQDFSILHPKGQCRNPINYLRDGVTTALTPLAVEVGTAVKENRQLKKSSGEAQRKISEMEPKILELTAEKEAQLEQIALKDSEITQINEKLTASSTKNGELERRISELNSEKDAALAEKNSLAQDKTDSDEQIRSLTQKLSGLEQELARSKAEITALQAEAAAHEEKNATPYPLVSYDEAFKDEGDEEGDEEGGGRRSRKPKRRRHKSRNNRKRRRYDTRKTGINHSKKTFM